MATKKSVLAANRKTRAAGRVKQKSAGKAYRAAAAKGGGRFSPAKLRATAKLSAAVRQATAGSKE